MSALFLAPHNDDETLFGAYTLLAAKPTVVVCLWGTTQGIHGDVRVRETKEAMKVLDIEDVRHLYVPDDRRSQDLALWLRQGMLRISAEREFSTVFAPMIEDGGHEQHNLVGELALEIFDHVIPYATYRRGHGRTKTSIEVGCRPEWPARKLAAMACYKSQIRLESTRPWFFDVDAQREWYGD